LESYINEADTQKEVTVPTKQKRDKQFLIYFSPDELERVKTLANETGISVSAYIRLKIFAK
ncbi:hypothetical protein CFT13S00388_09860, partial [Campylobacter fetus subsp. testudinum]